LFRGRLDATGYRLELERLRELLRAAREPHLQEFLRAWGPGA
jgi:hypothetical protein